MARTVEADDGYRVLRRLNLRRSIDAPDGQEIRRGLFVDVETTGLDTATDEIIEIAMLPFTFSRDGKIYETDEPFDQLRQPSKPIPAEVTALTGINDTMVAGKAIDPMDVQRFAASADLVIAHNASFDRPVLERFCDVFVGKPWACSMSQVDWRSEGFDGRSLSSLAMESGFFYDRHRAANDCAAGIELLSKPLPITGVRAMARLLENARASTWRIWAEGAPYECKDQLKARGYRWNGEGIGGPRAWYTDVGAAQHEAELTYLREQIFGRAVTLPERRLTAYDRFSERC